MIGIRILGSMIALILGYITFILYKKQKINLNELVMWDLLWAGMCFAALFSNLLKPLTSALKIIRIFDFLILIAILILLFISFLMKTELRKVKEKVENIVEHQALESKNDD